MLIYLRYISFTWNKPLKSVIIITVLRDWKLSSVGDVRFYLDPYRREIASRGARGTTGRDAEG